MVLHGGWQAPEEGSEEEGQEAPRDMEAVFKKYLLFIFGVTFIFVVLPLIPSNHYGYAGYICWIDNSTTGTVWRFVTLYGWLWFLILYIATVYFAVFLALRKLVQQPMEQASNQDATAVVKDDGVKMAWYNRVVRRLAAYPIILVVCWVPATVRRHSRFLHTAPLSTKGSGRADGAWIALVAGESHQKHDSWTRFRLDAAAGDPLQPVTTCA